MIRGMSVRRLKVIAPLLLTMAAVSVMRASAAEDKAALDAAGKARDQAAADDALNGWFKNALPTRDERLAWFRDARFGCFIHWGVYSELAGSYEGKKGGGYAEHIMRVLKIPREEYKNNVAANFDPEKFDAKAWVSLIKGAGMRYVVITSKHHDGFAMWPSKVTTYNIHDVSKFKRDPMRELSDECHAQGIKFGFYYSHAFDWEHPDAPGNDWDYQNPGGDKKLLGGEDWYNEHPEVLERVKKYVDEKAIPQLQELVTMYNPDIFWFDTPGKLPASEQIRIMKAVRAASPTVVIDGRGARMGKLNFGDYLDTADRPEEVRDPGGDWEAIPTVNNSYGYNAWDNQYHTPEFFIELIAKTSAKGGNILLNIGPKGDGTIDENATRILQGIGKWMEVNGESIHGTQRTPLDRQAWGDSTVKGNTLYLHVFQWPTDGKLVVGGLKTDVTKAYLLSDKGTALKTSRVNGTDVEVDVTGSAPDKTDSVIVLECAGAIEGEKGYLLAGNIGEDRLLAFDAKAEGQFVYGDGKTARYYAMGFRKAGETLSWPIRANAEGTYQVSVRYNTTASDAKLALKVGEKTLMGDLKVSSKPTEMQVLELGTVTVPAGASTMVVSSPAGVSEGISVFDVFLKPVK